MWKTVYDSTGDIVPGGWTHLSNEIRSEHQPIIMVEMLEPDLTRKGYFFLSAGTGTENEFSNVLSDGSIDVDYDRGTRRTAELTILNPTAEFTPTTKGYESEGDWDGLLYINRVVRIWRGVNSAHGQLYLPVGTFLVDGAETILEENMSIVNLTLSDFWKRLTKSYFGFNKKYDAGTFKNAIVKDFLDSAGIPRTGKYAAAIDRLGTRTEPDKKITKALKFKRGDSRGEILKNLAKDWNIDMYFDPLGVFRTEDRKSDRDKRPVWTFDSRPIDAQGRHGGIVSLTRAFNDDNLYNHVILVGTGDEKQVYKATRQITNEDSKFHKDKIGDRVFYKENDNWSSQKEVDNALKRIWAKRIQFSESIDAELVCNPALEADDRVNIIETTFVKVNDTYRIRRFTVPLVTSRQELHATNIIRNEDIW